MLKRLSILLALTGAVGAAFAQDAAVADDLVRVEGASFILGDEIADPMFYGSVFEVPGGEVRVGPYYIAPTEVTVDDFKAFVEETGYLTRAESSGQGGYVYLNGAWKKKKDASWKNNYLPAADTAPKKGKIAPEDRQSGSDPVTMVSWYDAVEYCNWLSEKNGLTPAYAIVGDDVACDFMANGYRLPTEAEWELAAKGGASLESLLPEDKTKYDLPPFPGPVEFFQDSEEGDAEGGEMSAKDQGSRRAREIRAMADRVAWFTGNSYANGTNPVKGKEPNPLGLYDMAGNVWEWCWDWFHRQAYERYAGATMDGASDPNDPTQLRPSATDAEREVEAGKPQPTQRVCRGGAWNSNEWNLRASARGMADPALASNIRGFRVARTDVEGRLAAAEGAASGAEGGDDFGLGGDDFGLGGDDFGLGGDDFGLDFGLDF